MPDLGSNRLQPTRVGTVCLYGGDIPNGLIVAMVVISGGDCDGGDAGGDHCLTCWFRPCFALQLRSKSHWKNRLLEAQNICGKLGNAKFSHLVPSICNAFFIMTPLRPAGGMGVRPLPSNKRGAPGDHKRGAPGDHKKGASGDHKRGAPGDHKRGAPGDHKRGAPGDHNRGAPGQQIN